MMYVRRRVAFAVSTALIGSLSGVALGILPAKAATKPDWTKNCTQLNKKYPHGVGKNNAVDSVSRGKRVTNFKRSNSLYATAMNYNRGLDRDKDGIACEK